MKSKLSLSSDRKLISLFAGAGGLDLGLELAGLESRAINELAPFACETLRANQKIANLTQSEFEDWFEVQKTQRCYLGSSDADLTSLKKRICRDERDPKSLQHATILEMDIRSLMTKTLLDIADATVGGLFLIAGGPPCQPFSRAGKRESVEVEDGRLFLEFVRIVSESRPRWFLFENVKGLIMTKTDVVYAQCRRCHKRTTVSFEDRAAHLGGIATNSSCSICASKDVQIQTERVAGGSLDIILREFETLGYECHASVLNAADFGAPQIRERLIIVGSREGEAFEWPNPTHYNPRTRSCRTLFDSEDGKEWKTIGQALWPNGHPRYGRLDSEKAVLWVKNVVRPHDEPVTWSLDRPSPTIGAHQAAKLALAPFGVPPEQLARQQWHTLGRRQSDLPKVPVEHSYLTDQELLKLQTFPESWYLYGTRMQRASQIGNAVPVVLAKALGDAIIKASAATEAHHTQVLSESTGRSNEYAASLYQ